MRCIWHVLCSLMICALAADDAACQQATAPAVGLRQSNAGVFVLRGARLFVSPEHVIESGSLVVRNGLVAAVGNDVETPADAVTIDMEGKTIYPGFIDAYGEVEAGAPASEAPVGGYANPRVAPQVRAAVAWHPHEVQNARLRSQGIAWRLIAPRGAIIRGRSALVTTADVRRARMVQDRVALHIQLEPLERSYRESFPNSIMGAVALVRQALYDARWHREAALAAADDPSLRSPPASLALDALAPYAHGESLVVLDAEDELALLRGAAVADEFGLKAIFYGSGSEYRRLDAIRDTERAIILPLRFPAAPQVRSVTDAKALSLEVLMHWDLAPENPGRLARAGVPIAFTTHGLDRPEDFLPALRNAVACGLPRMEALRALTTTPAELFDVAEVAGDLEPGKMASFVVTAGELFDPRAKLCETWVEGRRYEVKEARALEKEAENKQATKREQDTLQQRAKALFDVSYPLGAYGRQQESPPGKSLILFRNAAVWTCGASGFLARADVLVRDGKIARVAGRITAKNARVIDCAGKHLTPGLIDCHSHVAIAGGITDSGKTTTGEVRIGDVINGDDPDLRRQLAGGVTCANLLPGSDNTIAGQSQVVKLRWGALPEEMKFADASPGLKLALGENVKQSNWGDGFRTRYPQTRMGVEQLLLDRLHAAQHYDRSRELAKSPRRIDLELEALVEVLNGERHLHCHAYRQDEILAYLRLCSAVEIHPGTLHHASEAYKLADLLASREVAVSSFSDWWAYKFEAFEAIPHNVTMLARAGVSVSINSDDAEMARRLNMEAAKSMKYGGLSPEQALQLVTLAPAQQLKIDRWVGSIEPGKDADLVLWSGPPLSALSRSEQTWIDGRCYFDREEEAALTLEMQHQRAAIVQRILNLQHD